MKNINKGSIVFTGLMMAFTLTMCLYALTYQPRVRMVPILIVIATFIVSLLTLIDEFFPIRLYGGLDIEKMVSPGRMEPKDSEPHRSTKKLLNITAWMIGFLILIFLVGFYISIAVFAVAFLKIQGKIAWSKAFFIGAVVWSFIFAIFGLTMELHMFQGILFGELLPRF